MVCTQNNWPVNWQNKTNKTTKNSTLSLGTVIDKYEIKIVLHDYYPAVVHDLVENGISSS